MRVFLDTNVLASALGTRGLCSDVLRLILAEHELVTGEVVIEELRTVLRKKFSVPDQMVREIEAFLRDGYVAPEPERLPDLAPADRGDLRVIASALSARANVLVTGDRELLALTKPQGLKVSSPREFRNIASRKPRKSR
ncbi:MAG: putative toxin-antitoxin system toxin component, PIN family [Candidatus Binataceae bacterium]